MSGGGGFISNMQTSLKTNNRRKGRERERFKKRESVTSKKTQYNEKEISEVDRKKLVKQITRRRKIIDRIAFLTLFLAAIALAILLFVL